MLHELLFALQGYPGSIFIEKDSTFLVSKGLSFLHPSEAEVLNKLCSLGCAVKYLKDFVAFYGGFGLTGVHGQERVLQKGLYLQALCAGLKKILHGYTEELLSLEQDILRGPQTSLMHFQDKLDKYHLLFPALLDLVNAVKAGEVHGCSILETVHKHSISGIPIVRDSMNIILHEGYTVLVHQIGCWMLHGMLRDPYAEFFVHRLSEGSSPCKAVGSSNPSSVRTAPSKVSLESMDNFGLEPRLLPDQLSASLAKKVLFAGSVVCVFGPSMGQSLYGDQEAIFVDRMHALREKPELDLLELEAFVEDVRSVAATHVWRVLVEEGCLPEELRLLREVFLLGRGELFLHFSQATEPLLCRPRGAATEREVNKAFQLSCSLLQSEDENLAERFRITVGPPLSDGDSSSEPLSGWETIGMTYQVKWPLHVFLTESAMAKYSRLFRLLIGVQRGQTALQDCWLLQGKLGRSRGAACPLMDHMMHLRSHMAHLLDCLQYYLQVDVIESQLVRLLQQVGQTRDFEAIQHAHHSFLASLLFNSLIVINPAHECLRRILGLCQSLCQLFPRTNCPFTQRQFSQFESVAKDFEVQQKLLTTILSGLRDHLSDSQLPQLLVRLDHGRVCSGCVSLRARASS